MSEPAFRLPWARSDRPVPRLVVRPLQVFLQTETGSATLLLAAAVIALVWANSPWGHGYQRFWHTEVSLSVGRWHGSWDLLGVVDDGLMAVFFYVVGLEVKREVLTGELRNRRAAALPAAAALGGMVVPAAVFALTNVGSLNVRGWGIPMATDIAFALAALALVGRGLPEGVRVFLLALAIVDDIGAALIIAIFYSGGIEAGPLVAAVLLLVAVAVLARFHIRATALYLVLGMTVWFLVWRSGVSATMAGVALGLLTPVSPFQRPRDVSEAAHRIADETVDDPTPPDADAEQWLELAWLSREAVSPLARMENLLHPWTSFVVIPLFALANAGVRLSGGVAARALTSRVTLGVAAGLVLGKLTGVWLGAWTGTKLGLAVLPDGMSWRDVAGVAAVAGVGFTVSLFITGLAFGESPPADEAKIGIIVGSLLAAAVGAAILVRAGKGPRERRL